jgi:hypothetical protein
MLALLAFACGSAAHKAEKAHDELASWAATGAMLSEQWSRGQLPAPYVKSTIAVAHDSLQDLVEPLRGDAESQDALRRIALDYQSFTRAFEQNDRLAAARPARDFAAIARALQKRKHAASRS